MAKFRGAVLSCQTCGAEFKVPPVRSKTAKYCSNKCAGLGRGPERELPKIAIECKWCKRTFFERSCHAGRRTYCSNECRYADPDYSKTMSSVTSAEKNGMWSGGIIAQSDGYLYEHCSEHPFASRGYVLQHRLVAERELKKRNPDSGCLVRIGENLYLDPALSVHHKNGIRTDNRPENLQIMTVSDHQKLHNQLRKQTKNQ